MQKAIRNQRGQGLIEYLLLTALLAIGVTSVIRVMGGTIAGKFAQITKSIQGENSGDAVTFEKIETRHFRKRDMSDFMRGSIAPSNSGGSRGGNED